MRRKRKGLEEGKIVKEISNIWIEAGTEEDFASFPNFLYFSLYQRSFGVYTQQQYQMRSMSLGYWQNVLNFLLFFLEVLSLLSFSHLVFPLLTFLLFFDCCILYHCRYIPIWGHTYHKNPCILYKPILTSSGERKS